MREALTDRGTAVVYGWLADWVPGPNAPLRTLLGRDFPRYQSLGRQRLKERFAASRMLLRHSAAAAIDTRPEQVDLAYQQGGRPYLRGCDQVDVSLSHTDDLLVVGITGRGRIGVDTERADRAMIGTGSELQTCTAREHQAIDSLPEEERNDALVRLWTLKEAYSKAIGQGLRFRFTEFGFSPEDDAVRLLRPDGRPVDDREWAFSTCSVDGRFVVSAALYNSGFGDPVDLSARTALDEGMLDALLGMGQGIPLD